jgi:hypothetical protein
LYLREKLVERLHVLLVVACNVERFAEQDEFAGPVEARQDEGNAGFEGDEVKPCFKLTDVSTGSFGRNANVQLFALVENLDRSIDQVVRFVAVDRFAAQCPEQPAGIPGKQRAFCQKLNPDVEWWGECPGLLENPSWLNGALLPKYPLARLAWGQRYASPIV